MNKILVVVVVVDVVVVVTLHWELPLHVILVEMFFKPMLEF